MVYIDYNTPKTLYARDILEMIKVFKNNIIRAVIVCLLFSYRTFLWKLSGSIQFFLEKSSWILASREKFLAKSHLFEQFHEKDDLKLTKIVHKMNHHLATSLVECLELWRNSKPSLAKVHFAEGSEEILLDALSLEKGVVLTTGHIGNWELMAAKLAATVPMNTIVKKSYDEKLDRIVSEFRQSYGINPIHREADDVALQIERILNNGEVLGLLIDQDTKVKSCFVPFFGKLAKTPTGAASLALKYKTPLIVGHTHRINGQHIVYLNPPLEVNYENDREEEVSRLTTEATSILEQAIRDEPSQWVWFHQRWKTRPDVEQTS